jgi:hypothetical protein
LGGAGKGAKFKGRRQIGRKQKKKESVKVREKLAKLDLKVEMLHLQAHRWKAVREAWNHVAG